MNTSYNVLSNMTILRNVLHDKFISGALVDNLNLQEVYIFLFINRTDLK